MRSKCIINEELKYRGKIFDVYSNDIVLQDGNRAKRDLVVHNGGVCIICKKNNGKFVLVSQDRYGSDTNEIELVAGKLEKGEKPIDCAKRELQEETGVIAKEFIDFGSIHPSPAYLTEVIYCFIAKDLKVGEQSLDEGEFLSVIEMSKEEILDGIKSGKIKDAKTVSFMLRYFFEFEN